MQLPFWFRSVVTHRIVIPILAEHRWLYPIDWPELLKMVRFGRAGGEASFAGARTRRACSTPAAAAAVVMTILHVTLVYIACAHLNNDPTQSIARDLAALSKGAIDL